MLYTFPLVVAIYMDLCVLMSVLGLLGGGYDISILGIGGKHLDGWT